MDAFVKKLTSLLVDAFPPPDKATLRDDEGIIGIVTSKRFRGKDDLERQDIIWNLLDKKLTPAERKRIVIIVCVTPEEEKAHIATSPI